jgi:DNA (cytosine-5)-methyltransferase 1
MNQPTSPDMPLVSLFSGGGGLDYGLAIAGFHARLAVEIEPYACQVLRDAKALQRVLPNGHRYLASCHIEQRDITQLPDDQALELAGLKRGEAALLAGGPPCVTFSVAGRREGLTSETGRLYEHFVRLLRAFEPQAFLFENVRGIISAAGPNGESDAFATILAQLTDAGYGVSWAPVNAADYGVPQHRHRVLVIGRRGNRKPDLPDATHADPNRLGLLNGQQPWRTVRDAFKGMRRAVQLGETPNMRNHVARRHTESTVESFRATPPGKRNELHKRDRLLWDVPAKTIRAQGKLKPDGSGQKHSSHQAIHPDEPRQITPRESARIQTFPDWYPFPPHLVNSYRIIGDAVPCELARVFGEFIAAQLDIEPVSAAAG